MQRFFSYRGSKSEDVLTRGAFELRGLRFPADGTPLQVEARPDSDLAKKLEAMQCLVEVDKPKTQAKEKTDDIVAQKDSKGPGGKVEGQAKSGK